MLTNELIKCHLLNEDVIVRKAIYQYIDQYNICDDGIINVIIESQSKYQDHQFIYLLESVYKNKKLIEFLYELKKTSEDIRLYEHIDRVITRASSELLNELSDLNIQDYKIDENFTLRYNLKFRKKKHFSKKSVDDLWNRYWILIDQTFDCDEKSEEYKKLEVFINVISEILCEERNLNELENLIDKKLLTSEVFGNDFDEDANYLIKLILDSNIKKYSSKILSIFTEDSLDMLSNSYYRYLAHSLDSNMLEKIKCKIKAIEYESGKMTYYEILAYSSNDKIAKILLDYLIIEKDATNKTFIASSLCDMFYKESIPYLEKLIEHGYDEFYSCLEEGLYPLCEIFNVKPKNYDNIRNKANESYHNVMKQRKETSNNNKSLSLSNISDNLMSFLADEKKLLIKLNKFYNNYKFEDVEIRKK